MVTGATGTVGSEVVKQLSAKGANIRACCHTLSKADKIKGPGVKIVEFDYGKPKTIEAAFKGVEKLFLLTPPVDNMVEITEQLVEEAKKAGVKYIVKLSGMGADAEAGNPVLRWHGQAEKIIEGSGILFTFLRPSSFMTNFIYLYGQTIKEQNAIFSTAGEGKVGYVDVRDVAAVAVEALIGDGHEGKIYTITGPDAISYNQAAEIFSVVLGKKISHVNITEENLRVGFKGADLQDWQVTSAIQSFKDIREGRLSVVLPTVEDVTGKKPRSFEQFTRDYAEAFK